MSRARHYKAKYRRRCKFCLSMFMSKKQDGEVCYSDPCQRSKERERTQLRYQKKKKQQEAEDVSDQG